MNTAQAVTDHRAGSNVAQMLDPTLGRAASAAVLVAERVPQMMLKLTAQPARARQLDVNDPRCAPKPGGRKQQAKTIELQESVRTRVIAYLREHPGKRMTFTELATALRMRMDKRHRTNVFALGESGVVHTDKVGWGRRFWMEKGK